MILRNEYSGKSLMALLWVEGQRRYFVSSSHTTSPKILSCRESRRAVDKRNTKIEIDESASNVVESTVKLALRFISVAGNAETLLN